MPMIPCRPMLALMKPIQTKESALDQAGSSRALAAEGWPDFQMARAAAMVNREDMDFFKVLEETMQVGEFLAAACKVGALERS